MTVPAIVWSPSQLRELRKNVNQKQWTSNIMNDHMPLFVIDKDEENTSKQNQSSYICNNPTNTLNNFCITDTFLKTDIPTSVTYSPKTF